MQCKPSPLNCFREANKLRMLLDYMAKAKDEDSDVLLHPTDPHLSSPIRDPSSDKSAEFRLASEGTLSSDGPITEGGWEHVKLIGREQKGSIFPFSYNQEKCFGLIRSQNRRHLQYQKLLSSTHNYPLCLIRSTYYPISDSAPAGWLFTAG